MHAYARVNKINYQITFEFMFDYYISALLQKFCPQNLHLLVSEEILVVTPHGLFSFPRHLLYNTLTIEITLFLNSFNC